MSAAIILTICGMRPSVFERLGLWMVEWLDLNGKQANIMKTGNLLQLCDLILRVSVDNYFFRWYIFWKCCEDHTVKKFPWPNSQLNCSNIIFTIFGNFSQQAPILCVYSVFGGLTMAAPMGHLLLSLIVLNLIV